MDFGALALLGIGGAAAWAFARGRSSSSGSPASSSPTVSRPPTSSSTSSSTSLAGWKLPPAAAPYVFAIQAAEGRHGLPRNLLGRVLYQESRFREDIIRGDVTSSAGAVGIAQIIPRFHDVDPLDPFASISYAARYLRENFERFGSWPKALAAYNVGPTRLAREAGSPSWLQRLPRETQNYVREILADVPEAA